jgi:hypothetical protein
MKFTATIIIVATGEVDPQADQIHVMTMSPMTIMYPIMSIGDELKDMEPEARQLVNQVIAHNVVHRATEQLKPSGVQSSGPMAIKHTPPGERH